MTRLSEISERLKEPYDSIRFILSSYCKHMKDTDGCLNCENRLYALAKYDGLLDALREAEERLARYENRKSDNGCPDCGVRGMHRCQAWRDKQSIPPAPTGERV